MGDLISRQAAIDALNEVVKDHSITDFDAIASILDLPPARPTQLTDDDIETIRIHLSAFKENLCNQHRWNEAKEYEALIDRLTAQPEQRTDLLKAEIKRMKRSFTTCINSDYYTGYMSALSAIEGFIAQWEGEAK